MNLIGELAALTTGFCWAFTSLFFSEAGKRIGSFKVNKIRLLMAVSIYIVALWLTTGQLFSNDLTWQHIFWLGLSGLAGLVIGDGAGFKAMVMIGPRLTMLIHSTAPVMATIIAWLFLGEALHPLDMVGILLAVGGVSWVVAERQSLQNNRNVATDHPDAGTLTKGVILGLIAALGQATGLVLAKYGMLKVGAAIEPMQASFIRMVAAAVVIWLISAVSGQVPATIAAMKDVKAVGFSFAGTVFGPFVGVWMSLVAVKHIEAGIAATLNATTPIWVIPLVVIFYKEKVTLRALLGAIVTVLGVTLLMLG